MHCPFLKEAHVKFCQVSAFRKMIVQTPGHADDEKCSSPAYSSCPAYKRRAPDGPLQSQCFFLQEPLVQYCSAAAVTKFIPYSESPLSRCLSDSHRYCDVYLSMANPGDPAAAAVPSGRTVACQGELREEWVEGVRVPCWLWYSRNHMWLDLSVDGDYHVGIDGFLANSLPIPTASTGSSRALIDEGFPVYGVDASTPIHPPPRRSTIRKMRDGLPHHDNSSQVTWIERESLSA